MKFDFEQTENLLLLGAIAGCLAAIYYCGWAGLGAAVLFLYGWSYTFRR